MGWDITDFGSGDYSKVGLLMITLRNGNFSDKKYVKPYAEKTADSRGRAGYAVSLPLEQDGGYHKPRRGNLMIKVYGSNEDETLSYDPVMISKDGRNYEVEAGTVIKVCPGESLAIPSGQYHKFWGEAGTGTILVGEVSKVNDDHVDNRFLEAAGRFPEIEEDEEPLYLLYNEYPDAD